MDIQKTIQVLEDLVYEDINQEDYWKAVEDAKVLIKELKQQCNIADVRLSLLSDPMVLAKYLHDNYEQIAKRTNWDTQKKCKVDFEDLPTKNKNTMILLAGKLI